MFVKSFPLEHIKNGYSDRLSTELYGLWRSTDGDVCEQLLQFGPHLILMESHAQPLDSPQILYCGEKTLATTVFGADWATPKTDMRGSIDKAFREFVSEGYHAAIKSRAPQYELISVELQLDSAHVLDVRYERLLLPWRTRSGVRYLSSYTRPIEVLPKSDGPSKLHRTLNS